MENKKSFWNSDKLLSVSAIILSLGTLLVFIFQTNLIRKHQYATVMPYLELGIENYGTKNVVYAVENTGVGPALIEDVVIIYKEEKYNTSPVNFITKNFPKQRDTLIKNVVYSAIYPGKLIPANSRLELFKVLDSQVASNTIAEIFNANVAQLQIIYKSIYDEKWQVTDGHLTPLKIKE